MYHGIAVIDSVIILGFMLTPTVLIWNIHWAPVWLKRYYPCLKIIITRLVKPALWRVSSFLQLFNPVTVTQSVQTRLLPGVCVFFVLSLQVYWRSTFPYTAARFMLQEGPYVVGSDVRIILICAALQQSRRMEPHYRLGVTGGPGEAAHLCGLRGDGHAERGDAGNSIIQSGGQIAHNVDLLATSFTVELWWRCDSHVLFSD